MKSIAWFVPGNSDSIGVIEKHMIKNNTWNSKTLIPDSFFNNQSIVIGWFVLGSSTTSPSRRYSGCLLKGAWVLAARVIIGTLVAGYKRLYICLPYYLKLCIVTKLHDHVSHCKYDIYELLFDEVGSLRFWTSEMLSSPAVPFCTFFLLGFPY